MLPLNGHWIFICQKTEFHIKDGICFCVYRRGGFFASHATLGWRAVGVMGPIKQKTDPPIQVGDSLILAKNGEVFYTPPISTIKRAKKPTKKMKAPPKPSPQEREEVHI
jgi:hypothetical protein